MAPVGLFTIIESDNFTITCEVTDANPDASKFQFKLQNDNWGTWSTTHEHTYNGVTKLSAGEYGCKAENSVGTTTSSTATLDVQCELNYVVS